MKGFAFDGWELNTDRRILTNGAGEPVYLTDGLFNFLVIFCKHPRQPLSVDELSRLLGRSPPDYPDGGNVIRVMVTRLRKTLEPTILHRRNVGMIRSMRNRGYYFCPEVTIL